MTLYNLTNGVATILYYAIDGAGNAESENALTVFVVPAPPAIVNLNIYSSVTGAPIPLDAMRVYVNGSQVFTLSPTVQSYHVALRVTNVADGRTLVNAVYATKYLTNVLNIPVDDVPAVYFRYSTMGLVGAGTFTAILYINGVEDDESTGTATVAYYVPTTSNVVVTDVTYDAPNVLYDENITFTNATTHQIVMLPLCTVSFLNNYSVDVMLTIYHAPVTITTKVLAGQLCQLVLSTNSYHYSVKFINGTSAINSTFVSVNANDTSTQTYSFGWHSVVIPVDPNAVRSDNITSDTIIGVFGAMLISMVVIVGIVSRQHSKKKAKQSISIGSSGGSSRGTNVPEYVPQL
jgi:hypothetical protein